MFDEIETIIQTFVEYRKYILFFSVSFMVLLQIVYSGLISVANVTAWNTYTYYELLLVFRKIFIKCFFRGFSILWIKQQNLLYFFITCEKIKWILDSFLAPENVCFDWEL